MTTEANQRFTEVFLIGNAKHSTVLALRRVAQLGLSTAAPLVYQEWTDFAQELFTNPKYNEIFLDKEAAKKFHGGVSGMGRQFADSQLEKFRAAVDAASLLFSHSVLDSLAMDYCRITAMVAPERWEQFVANKKVAVQETKSRSYAEVLGQMISDYLDALERESLLKKSDRLFQVCQPPPGYEPLLDYRFDRQRLERLDTLRHELVHGKADLRPITKVDDEVWYLFQTLWYFMGLVNKAFDLRIDPSYVPENPSSC